MRELLVDFITSLDGYGAAEGWPGFWGLQGPEYLAWLGEQPERDPLAWANTQLVGGDAVEAVAAMKRDAAGPMRTLGSLTCAGRSSRRAWSTVSA